MTLFTLDIKSNAAGKLYFETTRHNIVHIINFHSKIIIYCYYSALSLSHIRVILYLNNSIVKRLDIMLRLIITSCIRYVVGWGLGG